MPTIIIIDMQPAPFERNPHNYLFQAAQNHFSNDDLPVFDNPFQARQHVRSRRNRHRHRARDNHRASHFHHEHHSADLFLSLSFEAMQTRNIYQALSEESDQTFFHQLSQLALHAPHFIERPLNFRYTNRHFNLHDNDANYVRALARSHSQFRENRALDNENLPQRYQQIPVKPLPENAKFPSGIEFNDKDGLIDIFATGTKDIACVFTQSNSAGEPIYQLYDRQGLFTYYRGNNSQALLDGSFKDPQTSQRVNIQDVFAITYDDFKNHMPHNSEHTQTTNGIEKPIIAPGSRKS